MANRWGNNGNSETVSSWAPKSLPMVTAAMKLKDGLLPGRKLMTNLDSILKNRDITLPTKIHTVKAMVSPVVIWMWELYLKKGWALKNWCFWTVVLEKTLESPLDNKEIKPVILKEINSEYSLEGLMLKLQYFGHLMWRADSLEKIQMLGKIEGRMRRGWPDKMAAGWHHRLNGHEFAKTPGDSEGQGSLECRSPWGHKESDTTEQLNNKTN